MGDRTPDRARRLVSTRERMTEIEKWEKFTRYAEVVPVVQTVAIMFEALQLAGADTSSYDGWAHWMSMRSLPEMAWELREAVAQLRHDYEEAR